MQWPDISSEDRVKPFWKKFIPTINLKIKKNRKTFWDMGQSNMGQLDNFLQRILLILNETWTSKVYMKN